MFREFRAAQAGTTVRYSHANHLIRTGLWLVTLSAASASWLGAWGAKQHSEMVDAALVVVPSKDYLPQRLGKEAWNLRYYVQMPDWMDCFVSVSDNWSIRDESFGGVQTQFYANDYLRFPGTPWPLDHGFPSVLALYRPFFFRALQALRTESPANAARWVGTLLHLVTDSGSPAHTLGVHGEMHVRMETWVDASRLDLVGYQPKLLGQTDETAAEGLAGRMNGLIEFSKQHAKRMLPLVQANNKAAVEPIETEVAVETAKVTADVVHTLLVLTARSKGTGTASLIARVSAPPVAGMEFVPAKLMLAGTNYSTLSEPLIETPKEYRASFVFHNLPAGSYQAIVERTGARPLVTGRLVLHPGRTLHVNRQLQPTDPAENLVRNPRFGIRWRGKSTPDSWHFDGPQDHWLPDTRDRVRDHWISDTIPVEGGKTYVAGYEAKPSSRTKVMLQWMVTHWKAIDRPLVVLRPGKTAPAGERFTAPPKAVYARFVVAGSSDPAKSVQEVFLTPKP